MKTLYLDCSSGISGDRTVGALCDIGVKPSTFEWELSKLDIGPFHMHFERQLSQNIEGVRFTIHAGATHVHGEEEEEAHDHEHSHHHGREEHDSHHHSHSEEEHHAHSHEEHEGHSHSHSDEGRSFASIRALIEKSELSDFVKSRAVGIFRRIAAAEGKIHGQPMESVTLHEAGAFDSIADIVCVCAGIEQLAVEKIAIFGLTEGRSPAAATLEILAGITLEQSDEPCEFITPAGAAIVAEFGNSFGVMPPMQTSKIGYGIGSGKVPGRPQVLRAILGET